MKKRLHVLITMSINRNCSVYREYGLDLLESTNQYQHILEMDDDGKTRYRGNPTPGHVIHMHKTRRKYFTHIEPMLLSKSNQKIFNPPSVALFEVKNDFLETYVMQHFMSRDIFSLD